MSITDCLYKAQIGDVIELSVGGHGDPRIFKYPVVGLVFLYSEIYKKDIYAPVIGFSTLHTSTYYLDDIYLDYSCARHSKTRHWNRDYNGQIYAYGMVLSEFHISPSRPSLKVKSITKADK